MKQYNTFFDCHNAKFLWRLISVVFNLPMPSNVNHMFTHWLNGLRRQRKYQALVGACPILWAIWLTRNDITFNRARVSSSLQVLFRGTYWIRFWAQLQKEEERLCNIRPNLDGPVVAHECCVHMFNTTFLVEQGWSQHISPCPLAIAPSG